MLGNSIASKKKQEITSDLDAAHMGWEGDSYEEKCTMAGLMIFGCLGGGGGVVVVGRTPTLSTSRHCRILKKKIVPSNG